MHFCFRYGNSEGTGTVRYRTSKDVCSIYVTVTYIRKDVNVRISYDAFGLCNLISCVRNAVLFAALAHSRAAYLYRLHIALLVTS
jgi:hypothetical protein